MGLFGGGFLGDVVDIGLSTIPGVGEFIGQKDTNQSNQKIAQDANSFNSAQAVANRDFQERMSNTSHQRQVEDLRAAGLNPMLAINGGSSTPSGSSASATTIANQNPMANSGKLLSSALDTKRLSQDLKQSDAQIALTKAQERTAETQQELNKNSAQAAHMSMQKTNQEKEILAMEAQRLGTKMNADFENNNIQKESRLQSKQMDVETKNADFSNKYNTLDNILNRAGTATGTIRNATSILKGR